MTQPDRMDLLKKKCAETSQAEVARRIGYKNSTICQILNGSYRGSPDKVLERVEEVYGQTVVSCPYYQREIALGRCAANRKLPFITVNPDRVQLWTACRECEGKH